MNISEARSIFPILQNHPDLIYLDSAATALKPATVLAAEREYYEHFSSNTARGIYPMAEQATEAFEAVRRKVASFIGATSPEEIIFTSGTTASLNLVALLFANSIGANDTIAITAAEHHSNYLPWKELAKKKNATLNSIPLTEKGELDLEALKQNITEQTKIFSFNAVSNVLGIINPVQDIVKIAKSINPHIITIVDAAQIIGHMPINVLAWDADFVAFSGHKLFGPTGTGVLFGKHSQLEKLTPISFGGGMVLDACAEETLYKDGAVRFESGTPHIAGVIGLGKAIEFVENIGLDAIRAHELELIAYTLRRLKETFGNEVHILGDGPIEKKSGIISFTLQGVHPHDVAYLLGEKNICVRAGLQCAAPLHETLNLSASTRISLSVYNNEKDIEQLIAGLRAVQKVL